MTRYCLLARSMPSRIEEYREAHQAVWPELLSELQDAGWRNYSLFLRDDGLLVGYVESDDLDAAQERVARTEVNTRWQAAMASLFGREGRTRRGLAADSRGVQPGGSVGAVRLNRFKSPVG